MTAILAPFSDTGPRISCLMVTANRVAIARRSIRCFAAQSWPNRELVIVDDGEQDYAPLIAHLPPGRARIVKLPRDPETTLGHLRNRSLAEAGGELIAQWDDDDWYHPDRLSVQAAALQGGAGACLLRATLMHLDAPEWFDHPYVGGLKPGVPGSIVHRADARLHYPETRRSEDTVFLDQWPREQIAIVDRPEMFLRAFHGSNTWERAHFERRVANTPLSAIEWWWRKQVLGRPFTHSRFRLKPVEAAAFTAYLADSRAEGLFA